MENRTKIPYQQLIDFLQGKRDKEMLENIARVRKEDPVYELFFELIERVKHHHNIQISDSDMPKVILSFSDTEDLLLRILYGEVHKTDAQQFIDGLTSSPVFCKRFLKKLTMAAPQNASEEVPELAHVHIKSDEEIFEQVRSELVGMKKSQKDHKETNQGAFRHLGEFWKKLHGLSGSSKRLPKYAFAVPIAILCILVTMINYKRIFIRGEAAIYIFDDKVPYEYDISTLREASSASFDDAVMNVFIDQFKLGMSDYLVRDYNNALNKFRNIQSAAIAIQSSVENRDILIWVRDYYFYRGISYLALSRTRKIRFTKSERNQHANEAINSLLKADSLVAINQSKGGDREIYFLGLAYGLNEKKDLAVVRLKRIGPESQFFDESAKLIDKWEER